MRVNQLHWTAQQIRTLVKLMTDHKLQKKNGYDAEFWYIQLFTALLYIKWLSSL